MLIEQSEHVTTLLKLARARGARRIEPSAEGEAGWVRTIREKAMQTRDFLAACTPGYYNNEGKVDEGKTLTSEMYGGGSDEFFALLRAWREAGTWEGLEID
jgi:cyclohexanone monooxygenase